MQKIGQAEETKLEPEFVQRVEKFHSTKKELNALLKAATSFHNARLRLQKANVLFHDALAMTGSHAKASPQAVTATQSYVTAGRQLDSEEMKFNKSYEVEIVTAIRSLLDKEVRECDAALKAHSTAHLEFDACNRKWKKISVKTVPTAKKQAVQDDLKKKTKAFNDLGHQVVNLTSIVESRKNIILHENLERYMVAQQEFFEKASKCMTAGDSLKTKLAAVTNENEKETKTEEKKDEVKKSTETKAKTVEDEKGETEGVEKEDAEKKE
eukprot:CAMPEP_0167746258 /NCGR_PEP_ID=MMETSP0110_2-20121227/3612_1 /TAXON_ID=629695 /ORGANISM="Gymnochlora sp., Strain CCMP2014" /LENGTH=267 /DNA_ID=CAMNT_0007631001 /DNA_START=1 /DNA_END=804 /DNA_ORIENTATION=-